MTLEKEHQCLVEKNIALLGSDTDVHSLSRIWSRETNRYGYTYNFFWQGRPIIQYPQDIMAMQEIIWEVRPDLIIETGIAHGGSLIFSASMLALLDMADAIAAGESIDPAISRRKVLGIDIDIRAHNRRVIEAHPMASRIEMLEGSSIDPDIITLVHHVAKKYRKILVCLDSMHTHDHVLSELEAYGPLVSTGSYCVVFDTLIEDMPGDMFPDRPWGPGNNPKTAVWEYLKTHHEFKVDRCIQNKLLITVAPDGFLRKNK
ncbi:cephalosporin hydroxylase family protein [Desulfobotulus sp. H1]|uniref:Cephalosporin hydroxylase family protein n=1 Tax=Desulfobotulus pelophilus TaxID=2823377 RepID=A0ABT3NET5_9BACT|nr:cephalosporin hydroxylase family protein [Desulfobotulus pelophilus]MCW7755402.1 cephalosporin hydroxylase family protein [Desulfobotulus pelophilus]